MSTVPSYQFAQSPLPSPLGEPTQQRIPFAEIISALSFALDLTEGQPSGHSIRSCIIGMRIGQAMQLPTCTMSSLFYALLLKDVGCSSNAARMFQITGADEIESKRAIRFFDWTRFDIRQLQYLLARIHRNKPIRERARAIRDMLHNSSRNAAAIVELRCEFGSQIAIELGLSRETADGIYSLDEMWNGVGYPERKSGEAIPLIARILSLSQTLEVFYTGTGAASAIRTVKRRSGRWFDPNIVKVVEKLDEQNTLWHGLDARSSLQTVLALEPERRSILCDDAGIDRICTAFAEVIDAKSHFTYTHSHGVAEAADVIARQMNLSEADRRNLRRASLLHDIGKLSIPNSILEKPGSLNAEEWACVRKHTYYTYEVLRRIPGFHDIAVVAANHHERLNGSGYHRGIGGDQLCTLSRILVVADMFDALHAPRPYRDGLAREDVFRVLWKDAPHALDPACVEALQLAVHAN